MSKFLSFVTASLLENEWRVVNREKMWLFNQDFFHLLWINVCGHGIFSSIYGRSTASCSDYFWCSWRTSFGPVLFGNVYSYSWTKGLSMLTLFFVNFCKSETSLIISHSFFNYSALNMKLWFKVDAFVGFSGRTCLWNGSCLVGCFWAA